LYLSFYLNNSGGRGEREVGTLEKTLQQLQKYSIKGNTLRLDGSKLLVINQQTGRLH
jgi:hypothetical protein